MRRILSPLLIAGCLMAVTSAFGDHHENPSVASLAWMTGTWSGPIGPRILEENWVKPVDGSIASLVRMTGDGKTSMVELIIIEEEDDTQVVVRRLTPRRSTDAAFRPARRIRKK